jgi:NCS1 family nucleobase:cation symporter-1
MGVLALVFVALANVTSTAVSIYASGLALRHVPSLRGVSWRSLMLITILPCVPFVFWPRELYDLGDAFLAYNGTMYAPISGIVLVDFVFLRRQKLSLWALFEDDPEGEYHYHRGFHWLGLGSLLLGQAVYLSLYDPISGQVHDLVRFLPASLAAFLVPAVVYGAGMRLSGRGRAVERRRGLVSPNI